MAEKMIDKIVRCSRDTGKIRNIAICAHIDHGKTMLSDNLLAGAGMLSKELIGKARYLDSCEDEQERGITIDTAAVSMVHPVGKEEFLINLLDTPGHVDFGGDVTRAMRAVDGCVVLVDVVEGVMPQTETVLRQALRERVKPVLFLNKVDRLINELRLSQQQIQDRFVHIIGSVNRLIARIAESPYDDEWQVQVQNGSVAFGSAIHAWALSLPYMQGLGIAFKDVIEAYLGSVHDIDKYHPEAVKIFAEKAPLHRIVLSMAVHHLPNPKDAQQYRIPKIWHSQLSSLQGKALVSCDPRGPACFVATKIVTDAQMGDLVCGRLFSGTLSRGGEVFVVPQKKKARIHQLFIYNGAKHELIGEAAAGNIIGIAGIDMYPGDTLSDSETAEPFERITHLFEPVVTKSIEPRFSRDLPRLAEILGQVQKEDPCIRVSTNRETGEILISGMGELHLEIIENRIRRMKHLQVSTSPPIVVYRESVGSHGSDAGISQNKENSFRFTAEPLPANAAELLAGGMLPDCRLVKKNNETNDAVKKLAVAGVANAADVITIFRGSLLVSTISAQPEIISSVTGMFEEVMRSGPLCREPCTGLLITLNSYKISPDAEERSPAQILPAVRDGIRAAILDAQPILLEPKQVMLFEAPEEYTGELSKFITARRGQLLELSHEHGMVFAKAKLSVTALFGFASELRSATEGRATSAVVAQMFEKVGEEQQAKLLVQIRKRKGMY